MHTSLVKYFQALHAYAINARYFDTNVGRLKLFRINYVFGYIAWLVDWLLVFWMSSQILYSQWYGEILYWSKLKKSYDFTNASTHFQVSTISYFYRNTNYLLTIKNSLVIIQLYRIEVVTSFSTNLNFKKQQAFP